MGSHIRYDAVPKDDRIDTADLKCVNWKGEEKAGLQCANDHGTTPVPDQYAVQLLSNLRYDAVPKDDRPDVDEIKCTNWKGEEKSGLQCANDHGTTPTSEYTVQLGSKVRYDAVP